MRNNLLLVLPDRKELEMLSKYLKPKYTVYTAGDPAGALQSLKDVSIQLIICTALPGQEVCSRLKSSVLYAHIPVILLTSIDTLPARIKNLQSGADAFVNRPLSLEYLEAQIDNLLANRKKIMEHVAVSQSGTTNATGVGTNGDFVKMLGEHICKNVCNSSLNVTLLARLMNMSRPTLYRKIKRITGLSPNGLINLTRLQHAASLLESAPYKVNEIAGMTGFLSPGSFGKAFVKQFKITPTAYQRMKKTSTVKHF